MSDHIQKTIADLQEKLRGQEADVSATKRMINELCKLIGSPEQFAAEDTDQKQHVGSIRSDQFYGRKMASVVREYLEMRRASGQGAAKFSEIYSALVSGGYDFDTKNDEISKASLRGAIGKNPIFHRLPNGHYGLTEWYPKVKKGKGDIAEGDLDKSGAPEDPEDEEGKKA